VCSVCGIRPSTVVDHIIAKAAGGTDERSNLRGICGGPGSCHATKTGRDQLARTLGDTR
jgi:5-methylcytosine-specific restriction endonuclease McrA